MKRLFYLLIPAAIFASCNSKSEKTTTTTETKKTDSGRTTPVAVTEVQPVQFNANVEIQAQINSDENVQATPQSPGIVKSILVRPGQKVSKGQVLATLDASTVDRNIDALGPQLSLTKTLYEKQKTLWEQNIGTEVQLMQAKTSYESVQKQIEAAKAQRDMFRIVSPINGTVDAVSLKEGDVATPGNTNNGIKVVSYDKLKAEANIGENYLGKVKQGNPVTLMFPDMNDSIKTTLTYVSQAVDPISRAVLVQIQLPNNSKLHPNMSCIMKINNYQNPQALIVPVSVIQRTPNGDIVYVADNGKARSASIKTGQSANGMVEILSGLNAGDQVITTGYEDLSEGDAVTVQK